MEDVKGVGVSNVIRGNRPVKEFEQELPFPGQIRSPKTGKWIFPKGDSFGSTGG